MGGGGENAGGAGKRRIILFASHIVDKFKAWNNLQTVLRVYAEKSRSCCSKKFHQIFTKLFCRILRLQHEKANIGLARQIYRREDSAVFLYNMTKHFKLNLLKQRDGLKL